MLYAAADHGRNFDVQIVNDDLHEAYEKLVEALTVAGLCTPAKVSVGHDLQPQQHFNEGTPADPIQDQDQGGSCCCVC
jgi:hypothetical protein